MTPEPESVIGESTKPENNESVNTVSKIDSGVYCAKIFIILFMIILWFFFIVIFCFGVLMIVQGFEDIAVACNTCNGLIKNIAYDNNSNTDYLYFDAYCQQSDPISILIVSNSTNYYIGQSCTLYEDCENIDYDPHTGQDIIKYYSLEPTYGTESAHPIKLFIGPVLVSFGLVFMVVLSYLTIKIISKSC